MAKRNGIEVAAGFLVIVVAAGFLVYALGASGKGGGGGRELQARFDNVGSLSAGADVKIGGVTVGRVVSTAIDPKSFQALVRFTVQSDIALPTDTSATVSSGGLLGGAALTLGPGGSDQDIPPGGTITITQGATNLEDLLGKFIFNVGSLADATQKSLQQQAQAPQATQAPPQAVPAPQVSPAPPAPPVPVQHQQAPSQPAPQPLPLPPAPQRPRPAR